tara:strand:+ start:106 stop:225 length:120 start_codon:yes stop_codon:yes gene_type:complete
MQDRPVITKNSKKLLKNRRASQYDRILEKNNPLMQKVMV